MLLTQCKKRSILWISSVAGWYECCFILFRFSSTTIWYVRKYQEFLLQFFYSVLLSILHIFLGNLFSTGCRAFQKSVAAVTEKPFSCTFAFSSSVNWKLHDSLSLGPWETYLKQGVVKENSHAKANTLWKLWCITGSCFLIFLVNDVKKSVLHMRWQRADAHINVFTLYGEKEEMREWTA